MSKPYNYLYTFTKHALFDLAVNESKAYHAFDEDPTTEWVCIIVLLLLAMISWYFKKYYILINGKH